jgi:SH3-like domain-containing protein
MNDNNASIGLLVVTIIVLVGVFIVLRAFWLWYWKIYEVVSLLKDIRNSLRVLERGQSVTSAVSTPAVSVTTVSVPTAIGDRIRLSRFVYLRDEPRNDARVLTTVARGTLVTVIKTEGPWAWIQTDDGQEGWAPRSLDR